MAFSPLIIALAWPLQHLLAARMSTLVASALVIFATLLVLVALAAAVAWGFSMIAEWLVQDAGRFQSLQAFALGFSGIVGIFCAFALEQVGRGTPGCLRGLP